MWRSKSDLLIEACNTQVSALEKQIDQLHSMLAEQNVFIRELSMARVADVSNTAYPVDPYLSQPSSVLGDKLHRVRIYDGETNEYADVPPELIGTGNGKVEDSYQGGAGEV